jgi:hypothetical protein
MKRKLELLFPIFLTTQLFSCVTSQLSSMPVTPMFTAMSTLTKSINPNYSLTEQQAEYPTHIPNPTGELLPNGWYRFIYPEAGYMIDYPPEFQLEIENSVSFDFPQAIIRFPGSIDPSGVALLINTIINMENNSLEEFTEEKLTELHTPEAFVRKETIISGHQAIIIDGKLNQQIVFIDAESKFYILILVPNMMWGNPTTNEAIIYFYKIVDTIKIY